MSDIRLKRITAEPTQSPLILQGGDINITNTTPSSSSIVGALVINGGTSISSTYESVSCTAGGALTVAGGVGITRNVYVGKDFILDSLNGTLTASGFSEPRVFIDSVVNKRVTMAPNGLDKRFELTDANLSITATQNSTTATTGAVIVTGGIGISSTQNATDASNGGALTVAGGAAIGKSIQVAQTVITGESNSMSPGVTVRYTGKDQIRLDNNTSGYASINMTSNNLVISNPDDIILQSSSGNIHFDNPVTALRMMSVRSNQTEFLQTVYVSNTAPTLHSSTGSVRVDGGVSIRNTTDVASQTSGGSFTTLGGVAIAKRTMTGDSVGIDVVNDRRNKLVLHSTGYDLSKTHQFSGFGSSGGSVIYQTDSTSGSHTFYSGLTSSTSDELLRIYGNRDISFPGLDRNYLLRGGGLTSNSISFQSGSGSSDWNFFTNTGQTTETNTICIFGRGLPNAVTDSEYLSIGWNTTDYIISSNRSGAGNFRNVVISANSSITDQFVARTDGTVSLASTQTSTNSSTGALVIRAGGLAVNNTTNAVNISNGGGLTVVGGTSIARDVYVGGDFILGSVAGVKVGSVVTNTTTSNFTITGATGMSPRLTLAGDQSVNGTEYSSQIIVHGLGSTGSANTQRLEMGTGDDFTNFNIRTAASGTGENKTLTLYTATNTSQLVLATSGNVGINKGVPTFRLDVNGTLGVSDRVSFTGSVNSVNSTTGSLVIRGGISISCTKEAESLTRGGALTVAGGVAVQKNLVIGGVTEFLDTTPSTSVLEASVIVNGGLSIKSGENSVNTLQGGGLTVAGGGAFTGDLYVGGSINGSGSSSSTYAYLTLTATDEAVNLSSGALVTFGGITVQTDANATDISNGGSILTAGGASIGKDVWIGGVVSLTRGIIDFYTEDNNVLNFYDQFETRRFSIDRYSATETFSVTRYDIVGDEVERVFETDNVSGITTFNNITSSSDKDTASVVFRGGVSVGGTTSATSLENGGGLTVAGGASIAKSAYIGGNVSLLSTTESVNVSTGALLVAGGVGISGNLNVLGNTVIAGDLTVNGQTTTINATNTALKDNVFLLNSGPTGSSDSGFMIHRYQQDNNIGSGDVVTDTSPPETYTLPGQTGMTNTQFKLTVSANALDNYYTGWWIKVSSGFSNNQVRRITSYNGTTRTATVSSAWTNQNPAIGDVVNLYHRPYVGLIYNETTDRFEFGSSARDPNESSVVFTDKMPIVYSSATSVSTEVSSSISGGALLMSGGISIQNTSDALSVTSGGTITSLGGASFGKTVYVGTTLYVNGSNMTPSPHDMFSIRNFSAANNQSAFVNITGLILDSSVLGFDCYLSAKLIATTNLYVNFHIRGVNKDSTWEIVKTYVGDDTGIQFNITDFGQIQYTTPNYPGFVSLTFRWRALVT